MVTKALAELRVRVRNEGSKQFSGVNMPTFKMLAPKLESREYKSIFEFANSVASLAFTGVGGRMFAFAQLFSEDASVKTISSVKNPGLSVQIKAKPKSPVKKNVAKAKTSLITRGSYIFIKSPSYW